MVLGFDTSNSLIDKRTLINSQFLQAKWKPICRPSESLIPHFPIISIQFEIFNAGTYLNSPR
jgi:hypothetical protein